MVNADARDRQIKEVGCAPATILVSTRKAGAAI